MWWGYVHTCKCSHECICHELASAQAGCPHRLRNARARLWNKKKLQLWGSTHTVAAPLHKSLDTVTSWKSSTWRQVVSGTGPTTARAIPSSLQPRLNRTHPWAPLQGLQSAGACQAWLPAGQPHPQLSHLAHPGALSFSSLVTATRATCLAQLLK